MKVNKRSRLKKLAANILFDIIGGFFYSTGIYIFAKNSGFAPGGLSGLALIINHLWRLPIGLTTLILNIPLIIFSFKFLGKKRSFNDNLQYFYRYNFSLFSFIFRFTGSCRIILRYFSWNRLSYFLYARILVGRYRFSYNDYKNH